MAIEEPPEVNLEDPDWRFPILEWLVVVVVERGITE
jgi:hypothetical protein